jgi:uncharacterized protein YcgI (DUF1989 family)
MTRSGKEGFLKELGRHGLNRRDIHANVNWFSKVVADAAGELRFVPGQSRPGSRVDLRFDMHARVVRSTAMHPLDPREQWAPKPLKLTAWRCGLAGVDDPCRNARPENQRAFLNNERYFAA